METAGLYTGRNGVFYEHENGFCYLHYTALDMTRMLNQYQEAFDLLLKRSLNPMAPPWNPYRQHLHTPGFTKPEEGHKQNSIKEKNRMKLKHQSRLNMGSFEPELTDIVNDVIFGNFEQTNESQNFKKTNESQGSKKQSNIEEFCGTQTDDDRKQWIIPSTVTKINENYMTPQVNKDSNNIYDILSDANDESMDVETVFSVTPEELNKAEYGNDRIDRLKNNTCKPEPTIENYDLISVVTVDESDFKNKVLSDEKSLSHNTETISKDTNVNEHMILEKIAHPCNASDDPSHVSKELKDRCKNHVLPNNVPSEIPMNMSLNNAEIEKLVKKWRDAECQNNKERNACVQQWSYASRLTASHAIIKEALLDSTDHNNQSLLQKKKEEVESMRLEVLYSTDMVSFYNIIQRFEELNQNLEMIFELVRKEKDGISSVNKEPIQQDSKRQSQNDLNHSDDTTDTPQNTERMMTVKNCRNRTNNRNENEFSICEESNVDTENKDENNYNDKVNTCTYENENIYLKEKEQNTTKESQTENYNETNTETELNIVSKPKLNTVTSYDIDTKNTKKNKSYKSLEYMINIVDEEIREDLADCQTTDKDLRMKIIMILQQLKNIKNSAPYDITESEMIPLHIEVEKLRDEYVELYYGSPTTLCKSNMNKRKKKSLKKKSLRNKNRK